MSKIDNKLANYQKALQRLQEGLADFDEEKSLARDGLIQRFEFTFELAWKTLQAVFAAEGLIALNSPKMILKEAFAAQIIKDETLWLEMLKDRNTTAYIYDESLAVEICQKIQGPYSAALEGLVGEIKLRIS